MIFTAEVKIVRSDPDVLLNDVKAVSRFLDDRKAAAVVRAAEQPRCTPKDLSLDVEASSASVGGA